MASNHPKRATIYDIAREAGVSAKTVSRVLNGKGGVGAQTRERILQIMERVHYQPHIGARTLRGGQRSSIGVTLPASTRVIPVSQGFLVWIFEELARVFGSEGEFVTFDLTPFTHEDTDDYARGLWQQLYKACIVAGPLRVDDPVAQRIHASGAPYLVLGRLDALPDLSCACVDYDEGAYLSTKFLIERGHRRIAMLKAFTGFQPGEERLRGYRRALEEAGLPWEAGLVRSVNFGARNIANVVFHLLSDPEVTALIDCSATEDASSLREGARRAGRKPGENFEIVAWTYVNDADVLHEASAHLWLPAREVASEGMERLAAWVRGEEDGPVHLVYHPVMRTESLAREVPRPKRLFAMLE